MIEQQDVHSRLAVVESRVEDNTLELSRTRERLHALENTQGGVRLLAEQLEWFRADIQRRETEAKERESDREAALRVYLDGKVQELIGAAFDRRDQQHRTQGKDKRDWVVVLFQVLGWLIALVTLLAGVTGHLHGHVH